MIRFAFAAMVAVSSGVGLADGPVVISQVYGGGGLTNAAFSNDFVELFNRSQSPQAIGGWTVQYASSTGSIWTSTTIPAGVELQPGQYYLIQQAGGVNGAPLPTADLVGAVNMGTSNGKVALVRAGVVLNTACPLPSGEVVDFVGYGSANCAEGQTGGALSALTTLVRTPDSCTDTDSNRADFAVRNNSASPIPPRNTAVTDATCAPSACPAEFNQDGTLNADDLGDYITCFFANTETAGACPQAEFNHDGDLNADDLGDFITAYFAGCP